MGDAYKSLSPTTRGTKEGNNMRSSVYTVHKIVNAYAIGCGVLATIEQWYPAREFNGTMVPHKRNSKVWPSLVTKEKTMKYPISAMCTVWVCACGCVGIYQKFSTDSDEIC